jgi:hypothetical protein
MQPGNLGTEFETTQDPNDWDNTTITWGENPNGTWVN